MRAFPAGTADADGANWERGCLLLVPALVWAMGTVIPQELARGSGWSVLESHLIGEGISWIQMVHGSG